MQTLVLASCEDTRKYSKIIALAARCGDVITLAGDLGAGKTTFAQFFIQSLSAAAVEVTSPTFNLLQTYPGKLTGGAACEIYHYDLYRVEQESALIELGLEEALQGITLIEWPERLGYYALPVSLALSFAYTEHSGRTLTVKAIAPHFRTMNL